MPTSNSSSPDDLPDKNYLYGKFQTALDWRETLHKLVAFKWFDVPLMDDDGMRVENNIKNGWGWKELGVAGALGLGGYAIATRESPPVLPPAATVSDHQAIDTNTHRRVVVSPGKPSESD